jgi:predicted RNase H-like nuclease (RuvC/YqgF family)
MCDKPLPSVPAGASCRAKSQRYRQPTIPEEPEDPSRLKMTALESENLLLREQLAWIKNKNKNNPEKDRWIDSLRKENQQYRRAIKRQNDLVKQLANTLKVAFSEYQKGHEEPGKARGGLEDDIEAPVSKFEFDD